MHFIRSVGYSAIWCLVQVARFKDDKYISCTFAFFEKATNLFNATGHHTCSPTPTKISIDILLPAAKTFRLKLAQPTSQNEFNLYLLFVGGGCILSTSLCWPLPTYPQRVVIGPHFEAWTRPEPQITSPNPARARHLFLNPDLGLKAKFTERNCWVTKNVVCRCCRYTVYHTENSNHLEQNTGIIWHKRSMFVNDNTAEYNVSREIKKLSRNYLRWRCRHTYFRDHEAHQIIRRSIKNWMLAGLSYIL